MPLIKYPREMRCRKSATAKPSPLKGCTRSQKSGTFKTSEHQMSHSDVAPRLARRLRPLVILAQPPVPPQPGERPLDDPTPRQHLELRLALGADDQLQDPAADLLGPLRPAP